MLKSQKNLLLLVFIPSILLAQNINETNTDKKVISQAPASVKFNYPIDVPIDVEENFNFTVVESTVKQPIATYSQSPESRSVQIDYYEIPTPKKKKIKPELVKKLKTPEKENVIPITTKSLQTTIEAGDFDTNVANIGSVFIPADPHGAAGPTHVVNVFNTSIQFFTKAGALTFDTSLATFFAGLTPANATFDPKVLYDQHNDRWIVVTLEVVDGGAGAASDTSLVLVAVSDDSNPNGSWTVTEINTKISIGGLQHWLDYPGLAVDDEAIYITGNMFRFRDGSPTAGQNGGVRLIVIDKGVVGGFYDGGAVSASIFDPYAGGGFATTSQPAHIYGSTTGNTGTWLVSYSGLSNDFGTPDSGEFFQSVRIDNPLTAPAFFQEFIVLGNIENATVPIPDAPQSGGGIAIDSGDRRALDAVWRDNNLYFTTEFLPTTGTDSGQATVLWTSLSTVGATLFVSDIGIIGGEEIGVGTYTSYGSIAVNADGGVAIGFTASSPNIFPSSYFVNKSPTDALGSTRTPKLIRAGQSNYLRTFGGSNRWGDYSATSVDPDEACFWIYNKYAITQGTPTNPGAEMGRWGTAHAHFCNDAPVANTDTANVDQGQSVTTVNGSNTSLLNNDTDADTPDDTLSMNTSVVSGPNDGIVTLNSSGTFSYSHNGIATNPTDSFMYRVCDDGSPSKCDDGTVNITINLSNQPPIAGNDAFTVDEGTTANTLTGGSNTVLDGDSDPDDINLTVTINSSPTQSSAFTLNIDGTFSYTHNGNETPTSDSFTYDVCDDEAPTPACDTGTVTITINPVNDAPTAGDDAIVLDTGATSIVLVSSENSVLANDTDPDDVTLTATINTAPINASAFTLNANGTFSYTHDGTTTTSDSFSYDACDDENPTNACDSATVNITINPVIIEDIFADGFEDTI